MLLLRREKERAAAFLHTKGKRKRERERGRDREKGGKTVSQEGEEKAEKEPRRWQAFLEVYNEALFCERL